MDSERILNALGGIDDRYIDEAAPTGGRRRRTVYRRLIAAAACICVAITAVLILTRPAADSSVQDRLLAAVKLGASDSDTASVATALPVEGRLAVYEQLYAGGDGIVDSPEDSDATKKLTPFVGAEYSRYGGSTWYRVEGMDELKYLISEDGGGRLRLWEFESFCVLESELEAMREAALDDILEAEKEIRSMYPGLDLSSYTYGDVYRIIYNVSGADDIVSLTASPSKANNTAEGMRIQDAVGTHTYTERSDIETFYDITVDVACTGLHDWSGYSENRDRFSYSFSTDARDKLTSGEEIWGSRYLTVTLGSGTTIDSWKYTALGGMFYEFGGIMTVPLDEEDVFALNSIFGIE